MSNREVMQQALEALEGLFGLPNQWESGGVAVWRLGGSDASRQAITALRTALEQQAEPVQEPVACRFCHSKKGSWTWQCYTCDEIDDVQQPALPQQQAEPPPEWLLIKNILDEYGLDAIAFVAEWKAAQRPWVGLMDEFCITNMVDVGHCSLQIVFKSRKNADEFKAALKEKNHDRRRSL